MTPTITTFICGSLFGCILGLGLVLCHERRQHHRWLAYARRIRRQNRTVNLD